MNFSNNIFNASFNKNVSLKDFNNLEKNTSKHKQINNNKNDNKKNIKEIKINLNSKEKNKINYKENQFLEKIIYLQKWWKTMNKIILIQKNVRKFLEMKKIIKIIYLIKMIFKLIFHKIISTFGQKKIGNKEKKEFFNQIKNNLKRNDIKKIKKYDTSSKFYIKGKLINNNRTINSITNNNYSKKNIEDNKKNIISEIININKESYKNKKMNNNDNENNIKTSNNKQKLFKAKFMEKTIYNINNKEKLKAYKNINNIYDNIKKIYEDYYNKTNCSSSNNFYIKNKNINKKIKNEKKKNENIKTSKNSDENENIIYNRKEELSKKNNQNKVEINSLNIEKLKEKFEFWKEYIIKKSIIEKLKNKFLMKSHLLLKKKFSNKKRRIISVTTKKLDLSNSNISQRLSNISPKELNFKSNNQQKNITLNNCYSDKRYKSNKSVNKNNNYSLFNKINIKNKIYFSNSHQNIFKKYNDICNKNKSIHYKNEEYKKDSLNNKERLYPLYKIIKKLEIKNNSIIKRQYLNKWKILNKGKNNFITFMNPIEEKIIRFKKVKSPRNNYYLFHTKKNGNYLYQNNKTESNISYSHVRANSINFQEKNLDIQSINNTSKDCIYKSNTKSKAIVYKKKFLNVNKTRNIEEINLTLGNSLSEFNLLNKTNEYDKNLDNKNITYNSIYGGKILKDTTRNFGNLYNKIEEREICFTPKKNSIFKNGLGINVNIVENYLNKKDKIEEYKRNNPKMINKIKTKTIFFPD